MYVFAMLTFCLHKLGIDWHMPTPITHLCFAFFALLARGSALSDNTLEYVMQFHLLYLVLSKENTEKCKKWCTYWKNCTMYYVPKSICTEMEIAQCSS